MWWFFKDIFLVVGLVVMAIIFVINTIGTAFDIQQIRENIAYWGLTWFELLTFIGMFAFGVVVVRLIWRLNKFEKAKPIINTRLMSFPMSGARVLHKRLRGKPIQPEAGYAKIAVRNVGGLLESCIGTITGIAKVFTIEGQIHIQPLIFTNTQVPWDDGEFTINIPKDGVDRYIRLAYLDQNKPDFWQLAIEREKREDYFSGWHKIDIVISSIATQMEPLKVEVALGFAEREAPAPPSGLNLWPWDKWQETRLEELRQERNRGGSQN